MTYIYALSFPLGNIRYIGKSNNPVERLRKHCSEAMYRHKNRKDKWIKSLFPEKPFLTILEEVEEINWEEREIYWINYFKEQGNDLVNGTSGGEGSDGFRNKKHTEETKNKIKNKLIGRKHSKETLEKFSGSNNPNSKLNFEQLEKIYKMIFVENISHKEIAKKFNLNPKHIGQLKSGKRRKKELENFKTMNLHLTLVDNIGNICIGAEKSALKGYVMYNEEDDCK